MSLDPHAVLLHASLEGELELVKSVIHQVGMNDLKLWQGRGRGDVIAPNVLMVSSKKRCTKHPFIFLFFIHYIFNRG